MKHGKKPTVTQRKLMTENGLEWESWLVVKDLQDLMVVVNRFTGEQKEISK